MEQKRTVKLPPMKDHPHPSESTGTEPAALLPETRQAKMPFEIWREKFKTAGWFTSPGAYVLVDGQFGSTGKGLAEQVLCLLGGERVDAVQTNAGPNSGHTIYSDILTKIVTKQIPSFSVQAGMMNFRIPLHLNAGAIIDPKILTEELQWLGRSELTLHPHASAILPKHYLPTPSLDAIASTQKGTGPATADKVLRKRFSVVENVHDFEGFKQSKGETERMGVVFISTAQGFSLGINSGFFPHTTQRECTVQQALSDARIPARKLQKVIATFRAFPIRVGSTPLGSSGGWYGDQKELSWSEVGVEPELTTVTQRQRRIATWSDIQFRECLAVNDPDALFINFLNYFKTALEATKFVEDVVSRFTQMKGSKGPDFVMLGFGPYARDVEIAFNREDLGNLIFKRMANIDIAAVEKAGY